MPTDESSRIHLYSQPDTQDKTFRLLICLKAGVNSSYNAAQITTGEELPGNTDILILPYLNPQDDEALYSFIKQVENQTSLERILILPKRFQTSKNHFPAALHDIRFQQHHLVFYEADICHEDVVSTIDQLISEILIKKQRAAEQNAVKSRGLAALWSKTRVRTGIYLLPVFALLLWGLIQILPRTLTLLASNESLRNVVSAPEITSIWLADSFNTIDQSLWTQVHQFKGTHPISVETDNSDLVFFTSEPVREDMYKLQSSQTWPFDNLQSLHVTFRIDEPTDAEAEVIITQEIYNVENPNRFIACDIRSGVETGSIECFIQDEDQKIILSNQMIFSLQESHDLTLVFIPSRYSMRFFLDDQFYGEMEIPSVEYWRERNFSLTLKSSINNLKSGSYMARIENLTLSQQP